MTDTLSCVHLPIFGKSHQEIICGGVNLIITDEKNLGGRTMGLSGGQGCGRSFFSDGGQHRIWMENPLWHVGHRLDDPVWPIGVMVEII
jgi:hypothetical protein